MYLISNFVFCGPKLDLRKKKHGHIEQWENGSTCCPLNIYPLPRYPSGHCLMASEFYLGQLIFMTNLPWWQVVKKVKLHHCKSSPQLTYDSVGKLYSMLVYLIQHGRSCFIYYLPNDSFTGRYDLIINIGVPATWDSSYTWPRRRVNTP
jgi:hypothetical protein